jgi:hypothetical protein
MAALTAAEIDNSDGLKALNFLFMVQLPLKLFFVRI